MKAIRTLLFFLLVSLFLSRTLFGWYETAKYEKNGQRIFRVEGFLDDEAKVKVGKIYLHVGEVVKLVVNLHPILRLDPLGDQYDCYSYIIWNDTVCYEQDKEESDIWSLWKSYTAHELYLFVQDLSSDILELVPGAVPSDYSFKVKNKGNLDLVFQGRINTSYFSQAIGHEIIRDYKITVPIAAN